MQIQGIELIVRQSGVCAWRNGPLLDLRAVADLDEEIQIPGV
jgi:hypothetical protein